MTAVHPADASDLAVTSSYRPPNARELERHLADVEDVRRWLTTAGCVIQPFWESPFAYEAVAEPRAKLDQIADDGALVKAFPFAKLRRINGVYCVIVAKRAVFDFPRAYFFASLAALAVGFLAVFFRDELVQLMNSSLP